MAEQLKRANRQLAATKKVEEVVAPSVADNALLHEKLDKLIDLGKAIDWKMWVYLKANNYIE